MFSFNFIPYLRDDLVLGPFHQIRTLFLQYHGLKSNSFFAKRRTYHFVIALKFFVKSMEVSINYITNRGVFIWFQ